MKKERWRLKNMKLPVDHEWIGDGIKVGETCQGQIVEAWMLEDGPWAQEGRKLRNPLWKKKCSEASQLVRVQKPQAKPVLPQAKPVLPVVKKKYPPVPEWRGSKSMEELKKLSHQADW